MMISSLILAWVFAKSAGAQEAVDLNTLDARPAPVTRPAQPPAPQPSRPTVTAPAQVVPPQTPTATAAQPAPQPTDEAIDLNTLDARPRPQPQVMPQQQQRATPPARPAQPSVMPQPRSGMNYSHQPSLAHPMFKLMFDLALYWQPGIADFTFGNFHSLILLEVVPDPDIQFSTEVNPNPRYFELAYQVAPRLQLRFGKIWIPFDDMSPHNIFGGRVNVSRLALSSAFLPDLWTDLGVAARYRLIETGGLMLDGHLYVVNGFRSGGTDPQNPTSGPDNYPSFSDLPTTSDNNRDKSIGGRLHALLWRKWGLGASYYRGRWSGETRDSKGLEMYGADSQLRLGRTELRAGIITMKVDIPGDTFYRGGTYFEWGQKFGVDEQFKFLGRAGYVQLDNRVLDVTDQRIVGGALLWKPNLIQWSFEHSRDLQTRGNKKNYSLTAIRMVMAF